jgi:hypothetical protein
MHLLCVVIVTKDWFPSQRAKDANNLLWNMKQQGEKITPVEHTSHILYVLFVTLQSSIQLRHKPTTANLTVRQTHHI